LTPTFSSIGFDRRLQEKQRLATELLRSRIAEGTAYLAHQAIVEFVAAVTRQLDGSEPLLTPPMPVGRPRSCWPQFDVLFPDENW
jgi:hypothetical protein